MTREQRRDKRVTERFFADGNYRLACSVRVLSRYRVVVTPPEGGEPVVVTRFKRPGVHTRQVRESAD